MKLLKKKNKDGRGRPKMTEDQKQKHARMAMYPETHARIKKLAKKADKDMIAWLEDFIPKI